MRSENSRSPIRGLVIALATVALLGGIAATPARADDDDDGWRHRGWREHEWREREWREHEWRERREWCAYHPYECGRPYPGYVYVAPPPPPVIYSAPPPPPVVYAPAPSLDIIVPIHIR